MSADRFELESGRVELRPCAPSSGVLTHDDDAPCVVLALPEWAATRPGLEPAVTLTRLEAAAVAVHLYRFSQGAR